MSTKKCITPLCHNRVRGRGHKCSTCYYNKWKAKNPLKYAYYNLKYNAGKRKKYFDLTLEQFEKFCVETLYLVGKGKTKFSFSVDCIKNELGYTDGNLQVLYLTDNASKGTKTKQLVYDWQNRIFRVVENMHRVPGNVDF